MTASDRAATRCDRRRTGLAPRRDRHRRRAAEGKARSPGDRHRGRRTRHRQGIGPLDLRASTSARRCWRPRTAGLLVAGGGHAMAAGLTIAADRIDAFAAFLDDRLADDGRRVARRPGAAARRGARARRRLALTGRRARRRADPTAWAGPHRASRPGRCGSSRPISSATTMSARSWRATTAAASRRWRSAPPTPNWAQALLGAGAHRRLWLAGRAKLDDWGSRPAAELHVDDAAWAD